ncbi:hypothetical protein Pan181_48730 [Aeoliella mucimassa]|uniref:Uncharacterized protein n=1 Tax=Aeoliella mucimassa TaxID=2527972 RepID=A0A518AV81_9BACT|nr:hypothetical protein Pan181_48730 [Aeoliella mucimassa]
MLTHGEKQSKAEETDKQARSSIDAIGRMSTAENLMVK